MKDHYPRYLRHMPLRRAIAVSLVVSAAGCAIVCDAETSSSLPSSLLTADSLPASYYMGSDICKEITIPDSDSWWRSFGDGSLVSLIRMAIDNNYNLKGAMRRIEVSRQMLRGVYSSYYPSVSLSASYDLEKSSSRILKPYEDQPDNSYMSLGASVSWEIDLFGRVAQRGKGAKASLNVSRLEYEGMMLSVAAEVADDYSSMRMYERQLCIARDHLVSQSEMLKIVEARYKAGLVSALDVAQARNTLNTTRLMIPDLEAQLTTSQNALATLCGQSREKIVAQVSGNSLPELTFIPDIGIPADLLRRRPDVVEAEQQVRLYASRLGLAEKEWLPTISLNAQVSTSAHDPGDLFGKGSLSYSVSPQISWTLFDGFSRNAAIAEARAGMEAEMEDYNMTLLTAVQEVNNAIAANQSAMGQLGLYDEVIKESEEVLSLSVERYKLGLTDFSDVATAQISLLSQETSRETVRSACFTSLVALYKSVGGGWSSDIPDHVK